MLTVRYIERMWEGRKYQRLLDELIGPRVEALAAGELREMPTAAAAAMALVRLDEMLQAHVPICGKLIRTLIALQDADGGWGDVATTALCVRALSLQNGQGAVIERGIQYLAILQQPEGIWPRIPIRRMPEDALVSAFVMLQLADNSRFEESVRFEAAVQWFTGRRGFLDENARAIWDHARLRLPAHSTTRAGAEASWS
jgi:hypothetical protein